MFLDPIIFLLAKMALFQSKIQTITLQDSIDQDVVHAPFLISFPLKNH